MSGGDAHSCGFLVNLYGFINMAEIQFGVNALREDVHGYIHDVCVAGSFAVAEQCAFHTVSPCQYSQLGCCYGCAAVVVCMQADVNAVSVFQVFTAVFNLVGVDIGCRHFYGRGQIDDCLVVGCGLPDIQNRIADFYGKGHFCACEAFGRIFKEKLRFGDSCCFFLNLLCACNCQINGFLHGIAENNISLQGGGGVIQMYDCFFCTLQCFEGFMDDVGSALCQHLYGNIIGNQVVVNQASCKFKFGIACRREADFDFLKPCIHQKLEEFQFFGQVHGDFQGLVAVSHVNAAPYGCFCDGVAWPFAVGHVHCGVGSVFCVVHHW